MLSRWCTSAPNVSRRPVPVTKKAPHLRGFLPCAEEDSNLHPVIPDQALNLARLPIPPSARGRSEYSPGAARRSPPRTAACAACVRPSAALPSRTHVRSTRGATGRMDIGKDLTKRQQEIFDFIKKYSARYGYPPTVRDIGKAVGLASSSTVHAHLANLEKVGLLRRDPTKPRAIELLDRAASTATQNVRSFVGGQGLPVVGAV